MAEDLLKKLVSLAKRRGYVFPGSEIYGGLANTWDYGPLGVELKNNIKKHWWNTFVTSREDMVGLDCAILMHPKVWEASGHLKSFVDPLVDCRNCGQRFRGDDLVEKKLKTTATGKSMEEISKLIKDNKINCPHCGVSDFTDARQFNLMFRTFQGIVEDTAGTVYMRPETAQGIFVNFKNVLNTTRKKLPFGIAQIGKSFRNEITPGNFIFRTREFEQMEIEYFVKPGEDKKYFGEWKKLCWDWFISLGMNEKKMRFREHGKDELSHYSNMTLDIEYEFPFGWGELFGLASRTDYDLKQHNEFSNEELNYFDEETKEHIIPYVIEPSFGVDRTLLTLLVDAYTEEKLEKETRVVMKLNPALAPVKIAVFPLKRNEERLVKTAREIADTLKEYYAVQYDDTGSIGKLYRRQDEIGTPFCITVDFQTIEEDKAVTIRDRDTMKQDRIPIEELKQWFSDKL